MNLLRVTNAKIILFFWTLACAGFGIYITISSSLYYYFMTLMIGIVTLNVRKVVIYQKQQDELPAPQIEPLPQVQFGKT